MSLPKYKIITTPTVYSSNHDDNEWAMKLWEIQKAKLKELGIYNDWDHCYLCHFFDSPFFDEGFYLNTIDEAIQSLAIKDGIDLVQFDNGNYGFVSYYSGTENGFEIKGA